MSILQIISSSPSLFIQFLKFIPGCSWSDIVTFFKICFEKDVKSKICEVFWLSCYCCIFMLVDNRLRGIYNKKAAQWPFYQECKAPHKPTSWEAVEYLLHGWTWLTPNEKCLSWMWAEAKPGVCVYHGMTPCFVYLHVANGALRLTASGHERRHSALH